MASWTDERVDRLKSLWLDGHSASAVARQLGGVTRNAVIGKVHRLGLSGRTTASAPSRLPRPAPLRPERVARPVLRLIPSSLPAAAPVASEPEPDGPRVPLLQLSVCGCRFGLGDPRSESFGFCGAPRARGSYCGFHAGIVYQPASAERAKADRRLLAHLGRTG